MHRSLLIIFAALICVVTGFVAEVAVRQSTRTPASPATPGTLETTDASEPAPNTPSLPGAYREYDEAIFAATGGTRLLFFHAPWCPQCRELDASIDAATIPENITIFKTDFDSHQALRQRYGVTIQTTVVRVDAAGSPVAQFVAYDKPSLDAVLGNLLR